MSLPLVSVGLPVFNGERFLADAIDSLLGQSYKNIELIISDNASTDGTAEICARYEAADARVRYSRLPENIGGVPNHNRLVGLARGTYFMWASHDDVWLPRYIETCVQALERDRTALLAYCKMGIIDGQGQIQRLFEIRHETDSQTPAVRFREFTEIGAMQEAVYGVIRMEQLRQVPLMLPHPGSDKMLLAELALRGRFLQVPEHLYMRRDHGERSVAKYPQLRDRYQWVAPSYAGRRMYPHWGYLRGFLAAILRAPLGLSDRYACLMVLLKWIRHEWSALLGDLTNV